MKQTQRLDKILAHVGVGTRSELKRLAKEGAIYRQRCEGQRQRYAGESRYRYHYCKRRNRHCTVSLFT